MNYFSIFITEIFKDSKILSLRKFVQYNNMYFFNSDGKTNYLRNSGAIITTTYDH